MAGGTSTGAIALRQADRSLSFAEDTLNLIAALAVFFLMFVGVAQIVGRTLFGFAIHGYIDWIEQSSSLFAFLGIAYAQRSRQSHRHGFDDGLVDCVPLEGRVFCRRGGHGDRHGADLRQLHELPARLFHR